MPKFSDNSLVQLTAVRFKLFFREPEAVFWIFVFPILLSVGLSIAFRNKPADVAQVGATTAQLAAALNADPGLHAAVLDESAGRHALATANILVLVVATPQGVTYDFDNTNPDARTARLMADRDVQAAAGQRPATQATDNVVRENGARYIDFVIPGLLGMNLMGSAVWGIVFPIVEARQKNLLKRLVASPMPRWQYLSSFLLSRLLLLVVEVIVFLLFAHFAFHVPFRGSLVELGGLCVLTSVTFSAIGLLLVSRARTMEAASGVMNLFMLPMWILAGVFFSASRFPRAIQPIIQALPLTAANNLLRGNMLQGTGVLHMWAPLAVLVVWFVGSFAVALGIFRWR